MADQPPDTPTQLPLGNGAPPANLIPIDIEVEMKKSYLDYAMSVIIGRALPDVRDGLKPVQRRILYGMLEAGLRSNRGYRKAAKIVGEVMGNYHPHGDQSIYDTLVRMAQPFTLRGRIDRLECIGYHLGWGECGRGPRQVYRGFELGTMQSRIELGIAHARGRVAHQDDIRGVRKGTVRSRRPAHIHNGFVG